MKAILCTLLIFALQLTGFAAGFTQDPVIRAEAGRVKITFAVDSFCVATVEIVDTEGKTVRLLASGLLGNRAPSPFLAGSLVQTLYWDKTDDIRRTVPNAPYTVRVGLGLKARFDRILAQKDNGTNGNPVGLVAGPGGMLYLMTGIMWEGHSNLYALDTAGRYRQTLIPYAGGQPFDSVSGFGHLRFADNRSGARVFVSQSHTTFPEFVAMGGGSKIGRHGMAITPDGWLLFANGVGCYTGTLNRVRRLLKIRTDGTCPAGDTVFGPILSRTPEGGAVMLALSPDGQYVYATGLGVGMGSWDEIIPGWNYNNMGPWHQVVYRARLTDDTFRVFIGTDKIAGSDSSHLNLPVDLATDNAGNLYVAEYGNNRISVYSAAGTWMGRLQTTMPRRVFVNPGTGELYVMRATSTGTGRMLLKYASWRDTLPRYSFSMAASSEERYWVTALDLSGTYPRIWTRTDSLKKIRCIEDRGTALIQIPAKTITLESPNVPTMGAFLTVDPAEEFLYVGMMANRKRINLATNEPATSLLYRFIDVEIAPDRSVYGNATDWGSSGSNMIYRFDKDEKSLAFPCTLRKVIYLDTTNKHRGPDLGTPGFCVGPDNDLYVLHQYTWSQKTGTEGPSREVRRYGPDGRYKGTLYRGGEGATCPRVDWNGNLFLAANIKPINLGYPAEILPGQLPDPFTRTGWTSTARGPDGHYVYFSDLNWYLYHNGCLFKTHAGDTLRTNTDMGRITSTDPPDASIEDSVPIWQSNAFLHNVNYSLYQQTYSRGKATVRGAEWQWFGISPTPGEWVYGDPTCLCHFSRFSVDPAGRLFVPQAMIYQVTVLDNNKNVLVKFGDYGNADNRGPASARPSPAIPFAWPMTAVGVGNRVYVSDPGANRILRVVLDYDVSRSAVFPGAGGDLTPPAAPANPRLK